VEFQTTTATDGTRGLVIFGGIEQEADQSKFTMIRSCFSMPSQDEAGSDEPSGKYEVHDHLIEEMASVLSYLRVASDNDAVTDTAFMVSIQFAAVLKEVVGERADPQYLIVPVHSEYTHGFSIGSAHRLTLAFGADGSAAEGCKPS
jgi:hypothetical protein